MAMAFTLGSFKRRRIVTGVALFMAISLISTGFATFVISSQSKTDTGGNVQVGVITDKAMEITLDNENPGSFILDIDKNDNHGFVIAAPGDTGEVLSVTISGNISNVDYLNSLNIKLTEGDNYSEDAFIKKGIEAGYIGQVKEYGVGYNFTSEEIQAIKNAGGKFSYTVSLTWGSLFNGYNPGFYFDNMYWNGSTFVEITENRFSGNNEDIINTMIALKRNFHNVPEDITNEEFMENQSTYEAKTYKITITASAA